MARSDEHDPTGWHSTNLVGIPVGLLSSVDFNAHPVPLHVAGAREGHRGLFALLQRCTTAEQARDVFEHYMLIAFALQRGPQDDGGPAAAPRRWRPSYLRLLQGWGLDANGPAGAVLKGWVESRFGLVPGFHGAPLRRFPSAAWVRYLEQKASSRHHDHGVHQQLDLVFEFCQWMLARFAPLGPGPRVRLWRGSRDCEAQLLDGSLRERRCTVRLNNVVSFTLDRDTAGCFGDWVMAADVPLTKLVLVPGLLRGQPLQGEGEVLAIGGDYAVEVAYGP